MDGLATQRLQQGSGAEDAWSIAGCCLSLDPDGTVVWAAEAARGLGWSPGELSGRHVSVLLPGLSDAHGLAERDRALWVVVDLGVRRDGTLFEAAVDVAAKRSPAGAVIGLTVVVRDATAELDRRRSHRLARDRESVVVVRPDLSVRYATGSAAELLGLRPVDLVPGAGGGLVHPADLSAMDEAVLRLLADPGRVERLVARLRCHDGRWRPVEITISNCLDDPDLHGLVARLRDVSERVSAQDEARLSAALHSAMVETSDDGIVVTDHDGTTRYANLASAQILGIPADELYDVDLRTLLGSADTRVGREEVVYVHPDGFDRILAITRSALGDEGAGVWSLLTVADVTESRLSQQDLQRRALYDPLTGLPNRYLISDRLEMAAARRNRSERGATAVLFIDLDGFKSINDNHGHDAGDELLCQVAERLKAAVRATDTVGRVGGDEFVVVCEDVDDPATSVVASRVLAALEEPFHLARGTFGIGASIGVALSPPYPFDQLVQEADGAMYRAKRAGGRAIVLARPG